jgi:hypothetical protein
MIVATCFMLIFIPPIQNKTPGSLLGSMIVTRATLAAFFEAGSFFSFRNLVWINLVTLCKQCPVFSKQLVDTQNGSQFTFLGRISSR